LAQRRKRAGEDIIASPAIMDWQGVKITEECGKPDPNVYDAHGNGSGALART
jgi:hypothetical protein